MSELIHLSGFQLLPVVELEPGTFATVEREFPQGSGEDVPDDWQTYWDLSLADSGITDLSPIRTGSWFVATSEFEESQLKDYLQVTFDDWGGISSLNDPDSRPVMSGGLALLSSQKDILVEPTCCSDLGDIENWKAAASYEGNIWEMLWIGHPWLSMKFQEPWLILSDLHESEDPIARWAVKPSELKEAVAAAEAELFRFSKRITSILDGWGYGGDAASISLKLVGLDTE